MTLDHDDNLWTTGQGGVVHWNIEAKSYEVFRHTDGMPGYSGSDILTDSQGGIWVRWAHPTYRGYGVSRYLNGSWSHYNASDGLADDIVNDMTAAPNGKIWVSTPSGISCFDGEAWTTYTTSDGLPSNDVGVITAGNDGSIWAHTDEGAASFDGSGWLAHEYGPLRNVNVRDIIVTQNGWVWFATSRYFISYDGQEFEWHWTDEGARGYDQFAVTLDGTLWARAGRGIAAWRNNQWYVILEEYGLGTYGAKGMLATQEGALWLTTSKDGLIRLSNWSFAASGDFTMSTRRYCVSGIGVPLQQQFSMSDLEEETCLDEGNYFGDGLQMSDGRLIFASSSREIIVVFPDGRYEIHSLPEWDSSLLAEPAPGHQTYGPNDTIWLYRDSIHQFDGQTWQNLAEDDPRFEDISAVETGPDGRVWVGSEKMLAVWDGQTWIHWSASEYDDEIEVAAIDFHGEDVWVADRLRGISRLIGGQLREPRWETLSLPEWDQDSRSLGRSILLVDSRGGIWASARPDWAGGRLFAYYDGTSWHEYPLDGYEESYLTASALSPDDSLLVGIMENLGLDSNTSETIYNYHLLRFDGANWQSLSTDDSLPEEMVTRILVAPDGSIWVAYRSHGVLHFDASMETWEAFNTSNVFVNSDNVRDMFFDDSSTLWILLGDGYARYGPPMADPTD
jgi:ligand-binding sensor domain-containing protein